MPKGVNALYTSSNEAYGPWMPPSQESEARFLWSPWDLKAMDDEQMNLPRRRRSVILNCLGG